MNDTILDRLSYRLSQLANEPGHLKRSFDGHHLSFSAVAQNQTFRSVPRLEGEGENTKCIGVKAWHFRPAAQVTPTATPTDCDTPDCGEQTTHVQEYDASIIAEGCATAISARCNNEVNTLEEYFSCLRQVMGSISNQLDVLAINTVSTSAMANTGQLQTGWTVNGNRVDVPEADFAWNKLGFFSMNANQNKIMDQVFLSGSNFYGDWYNAQYTQFNDNERSIAAAFNNFNFHVDTLRMDQQLGRKSTFVVDPNVIAFFNTVVSTSMTPIKEGVSDQGEKYIWHMPHPTAMYMKNGVMTPVMVEMEYNKVCTGRNAALGNLQYKTMFYGRVVGGMDIADAGANGETGVVEFTAA